MKKIIAFLAATFLWQSAAAEVIGEGLQKNDICGSYEVVHINGIMTTQTEALINVDALITLYGNAHDGHLISYGLAYNNTTGLRAFDIRQSFAQILADFPGVTFLEWVRAVTLGIFPPNLLTDAFAEVAGRIGMALGLTRPLADYDIDLNEMLVAMRAFHSPTGRVLFVGHSQGNIMAGFLFDRLVTGTGTPVLRIAPESMSILHVAAPIQPHQLRKGDWVTSERDNAINGVRFFFPGTLAANVTLERVDFLGHSFTGVYLAQEPSRVEIKADMTGLLSSLDSAAPQPQAFIYPTSTVEYRNCGDWTGILNGCIFQTTPGGTPQIFTNITILLFTADVGSYGPQWDMIARPGSAADALAMAEANVPICHAAFNSKYAQTMPDYLSAWPKGCSAFAHGIYDSWAARDADGIKIVSGTTENGIYGGGAWARGDMVCRKS